jgi:biotin carboxylase
MAILTKLLVVEVKSRGEVFHYRYDVFRRMGCELYYLTSTADPAYPFDAVTVVPSRQQDAFLQAASRWHETERFDAIITTDEASVIATALIGERLGLAGLSLEAAQRSRNKLLMREAHRRHDAPHPRFRRCDTVEEALAFAHEMQYPVVIKPTLGADSEHVYRVWNDEDLRQRFGDAMQGNNRHSHRFAELESDAMGPHTLLVEEYLDGSEHCAEAVIDGDTVRIGSIADRLSMQLDVFDNDLYSTPTSLPPSKIIEVADAIRRGAIAQGIRRGVLHAELRFHGGRPHIVEIAARPGGGSLQFMAKISYGFCPIETALHIAKGHVPELPPLTPTGRVAVGLTLLSSEGIVKSIHVPSEVLMDPDVFNLRILATPGAVLRRPPNGNDILGFVGTSGSSIDGAVAAAQGVAAKVQVTLQ